jgi:hypothetical protein
VAAMSRRDQILGGLAHVEQSRDKLLSSGQNVAVNGTTVGPYVFRRCPENRA